MEIWGSEVIIEIGDVIRPEKVDEYTRELEVIVNQLRDIKNNLIIMERLVNFPYHLFVPEFSLNFWRQITKGLFDSTIVVFSTVLAQGQDKVSLRRLKTKIVDFNGEFRLENVDSKVQDILKEKIRKIDFEKQIRPYEKQIRDVRNTHVAHIDPKKILSPKDVVPYGLKLEVFNQALDLSNKYFQILGLGTGYQLEFWDYMPTTPTQKLDVDEILEWVALNSYWFSDDPIFEFDKDYEKLSLKDKAIIDEWREKLGK